MTNSEIDPNYFEELEETSDRVCEGTPLIKYAIYRFSIKDQLMMEYFFSFKTLTKYFILIGMYRNREFDEGRILLQFKMMGDSYSTIFLDTRELERMGYLEIVSGNRKKKSIKARKDGNWTNEIPRNECQCGRWKLFCYFEN